MKFLNDKTYWILYCRSWRWILGDNLYDKYWGHSNGESGLIFSEMWKLVYLTDLFIWWWLIISTESGKHLFKSRLSSLLCICDSALYICFIEEFNFLIKLLLLSLLSNYKNSVETVTFCFKFWSIKNIAQRTAIFFIRRILLVW